MNGTHIGVVWNPTKVERAELDAAFDAARGGANGARIGRVDWFETQEDDPGSAAAQRALDAGAELVLAAGGDGTVRAVAERLAERAGSGNGAEMGIIPLGTGNLLARNLDIPLNDIAAALDRALTATAQPLDVGWVEITGPETVESSAAPDRHAFVVMAGFGIDAHMIVETDDGLKSKAGWLAYVESIGRAVSASEVIGLGIARDGGEAARDEAHTLIVGNCGTLQAGITLLPDADPRDGSLDLLLLRSDGVAGWLDTLRNLTWDNGLKRLLPGAGDPEDDAESTDSTAHGRARSLVVELDEPRVFEVDGDDLGETVRIAIEVQPAAIQVR
ncbi:diacylglycerol kinase family protein [Leucobacter sp. gxy201]|uniref:diacylglycerol/lipid kinase family protein n=1 Tax=Leucobacter sp. gxy201 TaxID=2957200 RepID=UPI003DA142EE